MSTMNTKARKKFLRRENKSFQKLLSKALKDNKVRAKKIKATLCEKKGKGITLLNGCKEMKSMSGPGGIFQSCTTCCQKHWCDACGGSCGNKSRSSLLWTMYDADVFGLR